MAAKLSSAKSTQPEPEINVTPLVDVVLVLLIIFMVVAPALNDGEHIELPSILMPDPKPKDMNPIDLALATNGAILLDKERIQESQLKDKLVAMHELAPERALMMKTDTAVPYKRVRETFAMLQEIGFKGLSLKVAKRGDDAE
jgi:biopolymer transport protein ExbD/biopolymer transport protein TolR